MLGTRLQPLEVVGPAYLAYLDPAEFRPDHGPIAVEQLLPHDHDLRRLIATSTAEDVGEVAHDGHLSKAEPFADLFEEGNDPGQGVPGDVHGRRGAPAPGRIHEMTAEQVRHQFHVRPR
jgi:hypothetical protein